jgi:L-ascorbate metabolism protein UlaG (beta-lactamase superfamily)
MLNFFSIIKLKNINSQQSAYIISTSDHTPKNGTRLRAFITGFILAVIIYYVWPPAESYVRNDSLTMIRPTWPGNRLVGSTYTNMSEVFGTGYDSKGWTWRDQLKMRFSRNPRQSAKDQDTFRLTSIPAENLWFSEDNAAVWLGHASFFIRLDGLALLTDPSYAPNPGKHNRLVDPPAVDQLRGLDYILLTSNQPYHADKPTLDQLRIHNPTSLILAPLGMQSWLDDPSGYIQEAGWFQEYQIYGNTRIYMMPARSWSGQGLFDRDKTLWGSFIVQTPAHTLYFAGSSGWGGHYAQIARHFPDIDYAFVPIGTYQPESIMRKAHLTPEDAASLSQVLNPKHIIPMSYGTFDMSHELLGEPLQKFQKLIDQGAVAGQAHIPDVGQVFALP